MIYLDYPTGTSLRVYRHSDGKIVGEKIQIAKRFSDRLLGLMFKNSLVPYDGLIIDKCNSVHTCFMRFDLDIIYLNSEGKIVKLRRTMRPWRVDMPSLSARFALEVGSGRASFLNEGDTLCISSS